MLRTQMFPRLPVRATFVAGTKFVSETQKMFLIFVRNIWCPQQMFPRLRDMDTKQMFCVPLVCLPREHHEQQCVGKNVSSFATTLTPFERPKARASRGIWGQAPRKNFEIWIGSSENVPFH